MDLDDRDGQGRGDAMRRLAAAAGIALALALVVAGWWWLSRPAPDARAAKARPAAAPAPAPSAPPIAAGPEPATPAGPARRRERSPREAAAPAAAPEPTPAAPAGPVLVVDSDVPGASVFFNRKYLGTTPLRSTEVTPGAGQLNASAEGYDGVVQTVDVAEAGDTEVTVRFKVVRLDATVAVVHKHAMGSCEGALRATPAGLNFDTPNKGDGFALGFGDLETFDLDYLQKTLKVKRRGGRTWNFTTKAENADPLLVFHRDVEKARAKLAVVLR